MKAKPNKRVKVSFARSVDRALRRSALRARETAKRYGTPIYVWEDGKVVAHKP